MSAKVLPTYKAQWVDVGCVKPEVGRESFPAVVDVGKGLPTYKAEWVDVGKGFPTYTSE